MRKIMVSLVVFFSFLLPFQASAESNFFKDIGNSYAQLEIEWLAEQGIIAGYEDRTFRPFNNLTRAQFAKMLVLSMDLELAPEDCPFTDVDSWAKPYVGALVNAGITTGITPTTFGTNKPITREQMTVMYVRAMGMENMAKKLDITPTFNDSSLMSPHAKPSIAFAQKIGFVTGNNNQFRPREYAQRQAAARLLFQFTLGSHYYFEPIYRTIFESYGLDHINKLAYDQNAEVVKIFFEDDSFLFYDFESDEFLMLEMFEVTGEDWLSLTESEKDDYLTKLIVHWSNTEEVNIRRGGVDGYDVQMDLNEYYKDARHLNQFVFEDVARICIDKGYFTWVD